MNRMQNPFSAYLRNTSTSISPERQSEIYNRLSLSTGESNIHQIGESLKEDLPNRAEDFMQCVSLITNVLS